MRVDCGPGVGEAETTPGTTIAARTAAAAAAQNFAAFTRLVSRQYGEWMAARSARDDDLKMAFFPNAPRIARAVLVTAETASSRGGSFARGLFVHDTALRGLRTWTCRSSGTDAGRSFTSIGESVCRRIGDRCGERRAGRGRATDRRSASVRRKLSALRRRLKRTVESCDGSPGYLLKRSGQFYRVSGRSGRRADGRCERKSARRFHGRPA